MSLSIDEATRTLRRRGGLAIGLLALVMPLAACGDDDAGSSPEPTTVSIAPSSAAPPTSGAPTPTPSAPASSPASDPSTAQTEKVTDIAGAVEVAESAVEDSTAVEASQDDDDATVAWEVTVRSGDEGRELRIGTDGSVLGNRSDRLDQSQLGDLPKVTIVDATKTAEKRVDGGVVTDAELSREGGQRVWDLSVEVGNDEDWELWIDPSSGKVLREERD